VSIINGEGPFAFEVDKGESSIDVDEDLRLSLRSLDSSSSPVSLKKKVRMYLQNGSFGILTAGSYGVQVSQDGGRICYS
jgi:hypothetical protein